jgi:hypothetical protein
MGAALRREWRVMTSRRAQSIRFRIGKWAIFATILALAWRVGYFRRVFGSALVLGVGGHLFWRWKTHNWTRAWGGWDDLDTARG